MNDRPFIDVCPVRTLCPKCHHTQMIGVEYAWDHPYHYDGISEWECVNCGSRIGRWTGFILQPGESEKPYGGQHSGAFE